MGLPSLERGRHKKKYKQNNRHPKLQAKSSQKRYTAAFIVYASYNVQLILLKNIYAKTCNLKYSHDPVPTHYILKPLNTDYKTGQNQDKVKFSGSYAEKHAASRTKTTKNLRKTASNDAQSHSKIYKHQKEQEIDKNSSTSKAQSQKIDKITQV